MNRRDKLLSMLPLCLAFLVLIAMFLQFLHLIQFNKSYMQEEKNELQVFTKQIIWAIKPILDNKDYKTLNKYCNDFNDDEIRITVKNSNGEIIADSKGSLIFNDNNIPKDNFNDNKVSKQLSNYHETVKDKMISYETNIKAKNGIYQLQLTISEADVMNTLLKAQYNIILFFIAGFILVLILSIYITLMVKIPFNELQTSATKIAKGDLSENIFVPETGILHELALAISSMAKQLKNQINDLQKMEKFRQEFIANISHEIKTPLTAILSAVEFMDNNFSYNNEQEKKCLKIISDHSVRLNSLVNDILSLSLLESRLAMSNNKFETFDLSNTILNCANSLENIYAENAPQIRVNHPEKASFYGDEHLIVQAVNNLITNAVKYSKSEFIDINLEVSNNQAIITVRDYGIGIPQEDVPRIFERFYRIDKARSRALGGTGLGLAIVKSIVTLHNGKINLETEQGKGCKFEIILPITNG